jgi:hypothetical protein
MSDRVMVGISGREEELTIAMPCAARHESGHLAVAAANGLRLRANALALDLRSNGLACYFKEPDGKESYPERVCLALYAGYFAERRFRHAYGYPYISANEFFLGSSNGGDGGELNIFLLGIPAERLTNGNPTATGMRLRGESELFVERHWPAIEELATALLTKAWEPMKPLKSAEIWSHEAAARYLPGSEAVQILGRHGIAASWDADS